MGMLWWVVAVGEKNNFLLYRSSFVGVAFLPELIRICSSLNSKLKLGGCQELVLLKFETYVVEQVFCIRQRDSIRGNRAHTNPILRAMFVNFLILKVMDSRIYFPVCDLGGLLWLLSWPFVSRTKLVHKFHVNVISRSHPMQLFNRIWLCSFLCLPSHAASTKTPPS